MEIRKLVIPTILLLMFVLLVNYFFQLGTLEDKYVCRLTDLNKQYLTFWLNNENNTLSYNKTLMKLASLKLNASFEMSNIGTSNIFFRTIEAVDPLMPAPCESANQTGAYLCRYYSSKETQDCIADIAVFMNGGNTTGVEQPDRPAYVKVGIWEIVANAALILIEGYLLSCILVMILGIAIPKIRALRNANANGRK
jgi:hypothetical protein